MNELINFAESGNLGGVIEALRQGANNNYALRWSATNGHLPVVKYLLKDADPPADINTNNDEALQDLVDWM